MARHTRRQLAPVLRALGEGIRGRALRIAASAATGLVACLVLLLVSRTGGLAPSVPLMASGPVAAPDTVVAPDTPGPGERLTLPVHLLARIGVPGEHVVADLRWHDGTRLTRQYALRRGDNGRGLLIENLDWPAEPSSRPPSQSAVLEVRGLAGPLLARQAVVVLAADDPTTQSVLLYWTQGDALQPERRRLPRTERIATAALNELLWGPPPGATTALPQPDQVLDYLGRRPDWGARVTLRSLAVQGGVATADFSKELRAYGGGSAQVALLRRQITQTLQQFPTVREVRITVAGQASGVLEP